MHAAVHMGMLAWNVGTDRGLGGRVVHAHVVELLHMTGRLIYLVFPSADDKRAFLSVLRTQITETAALPDHAHGPPCVRLRPPARAMTDAAGVPTTTSQTS
jgi:hypothetical protein